MIDVRGHYIDLSKVSYVSPIAQTGRGKYLVHCFHIIVDRQDIEISVSGSFGSADIERNKLLDAIDPDCSRRGRL